MNLLRTVLLAMTMSAVAGAQSGVLSPRGKDAPDPAVLSLEEMRIDVAIDNGDAHISIVQIFANHSGNVEEGTYRFALPSGATVSDFAVWDGPTRIPAVILERKQAEELYDQVRLQAIDPGLLQAGERDGENPRETQIFTAQIVPIPAYGTKRLEIEYYQRLAVSNFKQFFALPMKPSAGQQQTAAKFALHFALHSAQAIDGFSEPARFLPLTLTTNDAHAVEGTFAGNNVAFDDDFQVQWHLQPISADHLEVVTHRDPHAPLPTAGTPYGAPKATGEEPGFFQASILFGATAAKTVASAPPRTVLLLFDNSLSMQWDKLERSYAALEATLHTLKPTDKFNILLFNQDVTPLQPQPVAATPEAIQSGLDAVRKSRLRGGTDLLKALTAALAQSKDENTTIALFSDGGSNRGESVLSSRIAGKYATLWSQCAYPPHTDVFAVGDDANLPLLRKLAQKNGFLEPILSTEPIGPHLQSWISKLTLSPLTGVTLSQTPMAAVSKVYSLDEAVYPGSMAEWVGQYAPTAKSVRMDVRAVRDGEPVSATTQVSLPAVDPAHPQLPRLWAQARVNALLDQIEREGESSTAIAEIINLSRRYKFVTPYTSFLAVPRSLLRPRVIRPGDPLLRVRTDTAITSVIAVFPFGLTKTLRHMSSEDGKATGDDAYRLWETRFLAPPEMKDGTYSVRLFLRDAHGRTYPEEKTFVIASTPPTVKVHLSRTSLRRGETLEIRASASASTRTLTAHMEGMNPASLRWNSHAAANVGVLSIPEDLPIGRYTLTVTAEDIAHNLGSQEVPVDVIP